MLAFLPCLVVFALAPARRVIEARSAGTAVDVAACHPGGAGVGQGECAEAEILTQEGQTLPSVVVDDIFEDILADNYDSLDSTLPGTLAALKERGAHRCWHKHSTFFDHLVGVHNILRLWGQGTMTGKVGLLHSAYSNSYVNLALFDPKNATERAYMRALVGHKAEDLVHMFCIVDRQEVVVNTLLKQGCIPPEGITVPHLRNPHQTVFLSADTLRLLVVFTMADIADQYFGWQDRLFGGTQETNSMLLPGKDDLDMHESTALWPGVSRPGLWMSYVSDLGQVARTFQRDPNDASTAEDEQYGRLLDIPPVFDYCTKTISRSDEAAARDLYWRVVMGNAGSMEEEIATLHECIQFNPWAFEPQVMLAQRLLHIRSPQAFEDAEKAAASALELQKLWGTAWDKRLAFPAWVAWTRVLHQQAAGRLEWPRNSWDVNNFGLVE